MEIRLPQLAEGVSAGTVVAVLVSVGDKVGLRIYNNPVENI